MSQAMNPKKMASKHKQMMKKMSGRTNTKKMAKRSVKRKGK